MASHSASPPHPPDRNDSRNHQLLQGTAPVRAGGLRGRRPSSPGFQPLGIPRQSSAPPNRNNTASIIRHYVHFPYLPLRDLRPLFVRQPLWYACTDAAAREGWGIPRALLSLRHLRSPDFSPAVTYEVSF